MSEPVLEYLTIDPRAYKFVREQSMQDIADAFVELVTNSIDAYRTIDSDDAFKVDIWVDADTRVIRVIDQAIGLTATEMGNAFLQVGSYTATESSRGYFSRGAKDVSALGDLRITAIKEGKISQCVINTLGMGGYVIQDQDVTQEDRDLYLITENGLHFEVALKDSVVLEPERIGVIMFHYALRDILSDSTNQIFVHVTYGGVQSDMRLTYTYPPATKIVDMEYQIEGYSTTAHFTLYKTDMPIQSQYEATNDKYINFGIIVGTDLALNANGTLYSQIRYHPYISYLYGRIHCNYITELMHQLDQAPDTYDTIANPYSVIDPNRVGGLNRTHPFVKALYKIPYERILFILEQIESENNNGREINFSAVNDLFTNLDLDSDVLDFEIVPSNKTQFIDALHQKIQDQEVVQENSDLEYSKQNIDIIFNENQSTYKIKPQLHIKFSNKFLKYDYLIYTAKDGYVVDISVPNSLLKNFVTFDDDGNPHGLDKRDAQIHLNAILKEAIARILTTKHFQTEIQNNTLNGEDVFLNPDILFNRYEYYVNKIEDELDSVVVTNTTVTL